MPGKNFNHYPYKNKMRPRKRQPSENLQIFDYVHKMWDYEHQGGVFMSTTTQSRKNKHFLLDQTRLKKAQEVLGTRTETETIEIALERVISEAEANEKAWTAQDKFLKTAVKEGLVIEDVFGRLEEK